MDDLYRAAHAEIEHRAEELWQVALSMHNTPELAFAEHHACAELTSRLRGVGFDVEQGVAGLPTAFLARSGTGESPRAALLLEYDALPWLGHACGHNLIAAAGLGAAMAVRHALPEPAGTVLVVGCPAEESGGGKVIELDAGVFDGVDAALMFHPGAHSWRSAPLTAHTELEVRFRGKAAHPTGDPTEGVDALSALIQLFTTLSMTRARLPLGSHVQGIITEGGTATNIVPDLAVARFGVRGLTAAARDILVKQVADCAAGVALATSTTVEVGHTTEGYQHFRDNTVLSGRFADHLAALGMTATEPTPGVFLGSSDIGDVSNVVPAIHPFLAIIDAEFSDHTTEFAAAAAGPRGRATMLLAAEALARTVLDLQTDAVLPQRAWREFHDRTG